MVTLETFAWLLFSLAFITNGLILKYYPPKKFKWWSNGMALPFARKTEETWKEANRYVSTLQIYFGVITLVLYTMYTFVLEWEIPARALLWVIIIGSGLLVTLTRAHINKHFDENGQPR